MALKKVLKSTNKDIQDTVETQKPMYADLRQVMDYKRGFSMFYSGVEYEAYLDGCYDMGVRNFLMSYEYLKGKGTGQLKKHPDMHLFIDSGAFTYQNDPKYQGYTVEQWEEQIKQYLAWAERHKNSIFGMAELDLQNLLGLDVITEWRKKYFEPFMLRTGVPVCFIYHHEGMDVWEKMCQRYPYVGFSAVADDGTNYDLDGYRQMLKVAEKYNSIVHGFGMTRTSLLPQLPFYTVDSTSWKSGFRFGQIAIWNGKKVQMFKKDELENRVFPVIDRYKDITLDKDLISQYYEPEVLRANVYAYQCAEEYIADRLKSLMYWMKQKAVKVDLYNLPADFFPEPEWFSNYDPDEAIGYAKKMNINPELENVSDVICDATIFLNWDDPKYQEIRHEYYGDAEDSAVNELHDTFINRIVPDYETKVEDLVGFYRSCVAGDKDTLLQIGTNFDRVTKERDSYIEEEETELVDMSKEEVKLALAHILPPAELDEAEDDAKALDEEIYSQASIVPVFDSRGKFLKGQKQVLKPKQVYSKKYPKFSCDTCYAAATCPEYKAGYVCAYSKMFTRFDTRDMGDIIQAMQGIVSHNMTRMQRAMVIETLNGSIDPDVTNLMNQNMGYLQTLQKIYESGSAEVLRQTRVVRADGTTEETTQITNPQSGGILEKLFGSTQAKPEESEQDTIEVEGSEVTHEKNPRYNVEDE